MFNTINGSSNVGFIKAYDEAGLGADNSPIISVSIAEEEAPAMGVDLTGQYAAWNYFQSVESPENTTFIEAFQAEYGADRPTSDPMEAAYTSLYLYKNMVEKAESFCVDAVNAASDGVTFDAPEGSVTVNGENHHIAKTGLIGQINADNQFDIVWDSEQPDRARSVPRGLQLVGPERRAEPRLHPVASVGGAVRQRGTPDGAGPPDRRFGKQNDGRTHHTIPHGYRDRCHPAAGRARTHAHLRPDGRDQHGER